MKRDMDLVREILLKLEEQDGDPWQTELGFEQLGTTQARFAYHAMLLHEAGLIHAMDFSSLEGTDWRPLFIKWQGHEFLDTIRDPDIWKKTKSGADAVKSWSLDTLKEIAKGLVKKQIEEYSGVTIS